MRGVKCGLLLVLFTIFGLSFVVSSDVNAYKYQVDSIPFGMPWSDSSLYAFSSPGYSNVAVPFEFLIPSDLNYDFSSPLDLYYYNNTYNNGSCSYYAGHNLPFTTSTNVGLSVKYNFPYYDLDHFTYQNSHVSGGTYSDIKNIVECNPLYELSSDFNIDSYPAYIFGNANYTSFFPYRYSYNGLYVRDSSQTDGFVRHNKLSFTDLFTPNQNSVTGNMPKTFRYINFPIGFFVDSFNLHTGTSVVLSGDFLFDSDDPVNDVFELDESFTLSFGYKSLVLNDTPVNPKAFDTSSCSYTLIDNRSNSDEYPWDLSFTCPISMNLSWFDSHPSDVPYVFFYFSMSSNNHLWDYPATQFMIQDLYVVTDGDDTPVDYAFSDYHISGNFASDAPGSASSPSDNDVDFFSSLENLFSFNFINPFMELFELFDSGENCAHFNTLAGMLHSEENTMCPWFPASVRNVLTPVLGISSMMLVFGFAVHWLGARSGNLFEDSVETDNYRFSSKFRRGKK